MPKVIEVEPVMIAGEVVVTVPLQNDKAPQAPHMYAELVPAAMRLRASAVSLMIISFLFCGSLEGFFGMVAAMSVLCCAAPGALGTVRTARAVRIAAVLCAAFALGQCVWLTALSFMMPHMPEAVGKACFDSITSPPPPTPFKPTAIMPVPAETVPEDLMPVVPGQKVIEHTYSFSFEAVSVPATSKEAAHTFVAIFAAGARRLQAAMPVEIDPEVLRCERAQQFVADVLPLMVLTGMIGELCLFIIAMKTARRALELLLLARRAGVNGI